jgi:hypothetical protein
MSPPPTIEAACAGCFLNERTGGVCPAARNLEAERQAKRQAKELHAAVLRDAGTIPSLPELVRLEARQYPVGLVAASRLGLLATPLTDPIPDSRKEPANVAVPRTLR